MLVLSRNVDESIVIGDDIVITVVKIRGTGDRASVRIGISAPTSMPVLRKELYDAVVAENRQAATVAAQALGALSQGLLAAPKPARKEEERES